MLCLDGFIVLILKEFTVNKWRNPTGWLCAVAMPFALLLLSGCGSSDSLPDP
ncbi:type VI secretion lipoprotein/VasD [Salmonella enterica subsp. enterica serovar Rissen]|nr:type VI secretion lipoprotein/VasD [Salmonella enterica subsp. enterica serovar Rissen]ELD7924593.1 type VI secretion lipoprotein/VasD [Salmonella enterica subsp. enterica serovar Rissen]ELD7962194.1 type VI secretion lipoprotein/VasD [Salmonella enterica subsp. enterica serovar Rissen]ELR6325513.1 type VI secretion lipoprotein/VasD [Salmonella enterica subsp. enterica serovar Rissen]